VDDVDRAARSCPVRRRDGQDLLDQVIPAANMSEAGGVGRPASYAPIPPNLGDRDPHPAQFAPATSAEPVGVPRVGPCPVTRGDGRAKSTRMMWIESRRQPGRSSPGDADVERAVNVDFELRYAAAQRGERAQNDEFAGRGRQTGPGVEVAKGPGGDLAAEFGRDVCKGIGDLLPGLAIDLLQHPQAVLVPLVAGHASPKEARRNRRNAVWDMSTTTVASLLVADRSAVRNWTALVMSISVGAQTMGNPPACQTRKLCCSGASLATTQLEEASSGRSAGKR